MKTKLVVLFSLVSQLFFAQEVHYSGEIIDEKTKEPIFGVSVILNNKEITYSNELGIFEFNVHKENAIDSISFYHMSYEKQKLPLVELKTNSTIRLKNSFNTLQEVVITTTLTKDEKIIDNAIKNYNDIYEKSGCWTYGNYKQLLSYKDNPCGYFEIMGNVYQIGTNNKSLWRSLTFVPNEVRRTKENSILPKLLRNYNMNFLYTYTGGVFASGSFSRYRFFEIFHPLNEKGKKRFKYVIKNTEEINGKEYYVISYKQKKKRIKIDTRSFLETQGEVWVDKNDYSMLKLTVSYNFEDISSNNFFITYEKVNNKLLAKKISMNNYLYINHNKDKIIHLEGLLTFNNINIIKKQYGHMHSWLIKHRAFSNISYNKLFWEKHPIKKSNFKNGLLKIMDSKDINSVFIDGSQQKVYMDSNDVANTVKVEEKYQNLIKIMKTDLNLK